MLTRKDKLILTLIGAFAVLGFSTLGLIYLFNGPIQIQSPPPVDPLQVRGFTMTLDTARSRGRSKLRQSLKDPDSLQIITEDIYTLNDSVKYVAEYRAKNSFGGYVVETYTYHLR